MIFYKVSKGENRTLFGCDFDFCVWQKVVDNKYHAFNCNIKPPEADSIGVTRKKNQKTKPQNRTLKSISKGGTKISF